MPSSSSKASDFKADGADEEQGLLGPVDAPAQAPRAPVPRAINTRALPHLFERAVILAAGVFPIVVVWSLPYLAEWCDFEGTKSSNMAKPCFAHRCIGYPYCESSHRGTSVSDLIATPPATGLVAMSNAWTFTHLWWVQRDISSDMWSFSFLTMVAYQTTFFFFSDVHRLLLRQHAQLHDAPYVPLRHSALPFHAGPLHDQK
mmetsp:Transcript_34725/g.95739  ORF Transcript_34725/g.95739 Transcript_34725/m.95739 type:complete len:202 (-) Transcript_34725:456-1061(-)